ncbi:RNA polymerase II transcriptional coactivator, putative [Rhizoctonia solani AG-3 Rhs1AP]|uniref:RNA polymerase II transcriptional coactivator, putative n=1 Tax=Rhizoctonia solani AG-3 Rhs1AP TaxID=1086054 RepID=X8JLL6_9AGAM|nr:RNA polymerase II transcriptional coactivator, putative [Rhizoctonia solani AG-3 Rhs1AP]
MAHKRARKAESDEESGVDEAPVLRKKPVSGTVSVPIPDKQTDAEGNTYFEISGKRRVTVRSFNGLKLVDIREMYTDRASGELKPGKKGISLSEEQVSPSIKRLNYPNPFQFMGLVNVHGAISQSLNDLDVGSSSKITKTTKTTRTKASSSKDSKPAPKSKPGPKKKARKEESEEEDYDSAKESKPTSKSKPASKKKARKVESEEEKEDDEEYNDDD